VNQVESRAKLHISQNHGWQQSLKLPPIRQSFRGGMGSEFKEFSHLPLKWLFFPSLVRVWRMQCSTDVTGQTKNMKWVFSQFSHLCLAQHVQGTHVFLKTFLKLVHPPQLCFLLLNHFQLVTIVVENAQDHGKMKRREWGGRWQCRRLPAKFSFLEANSFITLECLFTQPS